MILFVLLSDTQGLEVVKVHSVHPQVPIVVVSTLKDVIALEAVEIGAQDYLIKK